MATCGKDLDEATTQPTTTQHAKGEIPIKESISFEECQENKIIRTNRDRITRLISSEPSAGGTWFAQKLEEKAFIANAAHAVVLGYTSYQQISRLMSAIKGKISTSQEPKREFSKFLEILESNPQLVDLARELRVEYGELGLVIHAKFTLSRDIYNYNIAERNHGVCHASGMQLSCL